MVDSKLTRLLKVHIVRLLGIHARARASSKNTAKCFIVSTGRTGTKFLASFFDDFPHVSSGHEPEPDLIHLGIEYAQGLASTDYAVHRLLRTRSPLLHRASESGNHTFVETNNRLFSLLEPLRIAFPDAIIVHVVRDGRDYVRSGMNRIWYRPEDTRPRLRADMFPNDPWCDRWTSMSRFQKITWEWCAKDGFIHRDAERLGNVTKVLFEDIFNSEGMSGLQLISQRFGLSDSELLLRAQALRRKKINASPTHEIPKWEDWSASMTDKFDDIAGAHLRAHYPPVSH